MWRHILNVEFKLNTHVKPFSILPLVCKFCLHLYISYWPQLSSVHLGVAFMFRTVCRTCSYIVGHTKVLCVYSDIIYPDRAWHYSIFANVHVGGYRILCNVLANYGIPLFLHSLPPLATSSFTIIRLEIFKRGCCERLVLHISDAV